MFKKLASVALLGFIATTAVAKDKGSFYFKGNLGYANTEINNTTAGGKFSFNKNSLAYGVSLGYEFNDYIRSELEFLATEAVKKGTVSTTGTYSFKPMAGLVNVAVQYDTKSILRPYAILGAGIASVEHKAQNTAGALSATKTTPVYAGGFGVRAAATDNIDLDVNVRYIGYVEKKLNAKVGSTNIAIKNKANQIVPMLGIAVKF